MGFVEESILVSDSFQGVSLNVGLNWFPILRFYRVRSFNLEVVKACQCIFFIFLV